MKWRDFEKRKIGEVDNDYVLRLLRQLGDNAYKFLHECDGHPALLLLGDKETHIKEMWRLWNSLDGTWNEERRYSRDCMDQLCEDIRKKPIRTRGKIHPLKSIWDLAEQSNRMYYRLRLGSERRQRVDAIFSRYFANIQATKKWRDAFEEGYDWVAGDPMNWGMPQESYDPFARTAGYAQADHILFPRSVYAAK